jgi:hypothetical protein
MAFLPMTVVVKAINPPPVVAYTVPPEMIILSELVLSALYQEPILREASFATTTPPVMRVVPALPPITPPFKCFHYCIVFVEC